MLNNKKVQKLFAYVAIHPDGTEQIVTLTMTGYGKRVQAIMSTKEAADQVKAMVMAEPSLKDLKVKLVKFANAQVLEFWNLKKIGEANDKSK